MAAERLGVVGDVGAFALRAARLNHAEPPGRNAYREPEDGVETGSGPAGPGGALTREGCGLVGKAVGYLIV